MPKKSIFLIIGFAVFGILAWQTAVQAGFGISPPYVRSDKIIPGTRYEQKIVLLRSSAEDDLEAEITVNAPEIAEWISIDKGMKFDLPKSELQVPMVVRIDTPADAALGGYKGHINIRIAPKGGFTGSGVSIALGARVDIDLTVTNETFPDFLVRAVNIPSLEVLSAPWRWPIFARFFYRIQVGIKLENTGNVAIAPTKVHLDVYDLKDQNLLESGDDKRLKKVEPFETAEISASFPTRLAEGQYWGKINIYKGNEVVRNDKLIFTIAPPGSLSQGIKSYGPWPWLMLGGLIILGLAVIIALVKLKVWRYLFKFLYLLSWPLRWAGIKLKQAAVSLKLKFWRWLHQKSARYQAGAPDEAGVPDLNGRYGQAAASREKFGPKK